MCILTYQYSFDGVEPCELVELFILYELSDIIDIDDNCLYGDVSLIFIENITCRKTSIVLEKKLFRLFKELSSNFTFEIILKTVKY